MTGLETIIHDMEEILDGKSMSEKEYEVYRQLMQYLYALNDMHQMFLAAEAAQDHTLQ